MSHSQVTATKRNPEWHISPTSTLAAFADRYDKAIAATKPVVVGPGVIDAVEAALILPQGHDAKDNIIHGAIVLTRASEVHPGHRLEQPVLRAGIIYHGRDTSTPAARTASLAAAFRDWLDGSHDLFDMASPVGFVAPLTAVAKDANDAIRPCLHAIQDELGNHLATFRGLDRPLDRTFRRYFRPRQWPVERRRLAEATSAFRQYLDPAITKHARNAGLLSIDFYNFMAGQGDEQKARYRQQAVAAYPIAAREFVNSSVATANIDQGWPPAESLTSYWQFISPKAVQATALSRATRDAVRRLQGLTLKDADKHVLRDLGTQVYDLTHIPADWTPDNRADFQAMRHVVRTARTVAHLTHRPFEDLVASTAGRWQAFCERQPAQPPGDLEDMTQRAFDHLVLPELVRTTTEASYNAEMDADLSAWGRLLENRDVEQSLCHALFGDLGLLKTLRANEQFHRRLPRLNAVTRSFSGTNISWPALSPERVFGNVRIVPLTSPEALTEEGDAMNHCVGGYTEPCLDGAHILSVRDGDTRLATARVDETTAGDTPCLTLTELRGLSNGPPDKHKEVRDAVQDYIADLNQPANKPDFAAMSQTREFARERLQQDRIHLRIGFDPKDPDAQEKVWQEWRHIIPGPARKAKTYDAFLELSGLDVAISRAYEEVYGPWASADEDPEASVQPTM